MSVITIKGETFVKIRKSDEEFKPFLWTDVPYQLKTDKTREIPKDVLENYFRVDLSKYSKDDLLKMIDVLKKIDSKLKSITTIQNWLEILKDPINAPIQTLESLLKLIDDIVSKNPLFFIKNEDGSSMPIKVIKTEKRHDREEGESYVRIDYSFLRIKIKKRGWGDDDDNSSIARLEEFKNSIYIYRTSILKSGEDLFDDSAEKKTLLEVLLSKSIIPYDEELMQLYKVSLENFITYTRKVGQQFYLKGKAITSSSWWYSDTSFRDVDTQIIIEEIDESILNKIYTFESKSKKKDCPIPLHPYIKVYDLINHEYLLAEPSCLELYEYNEKIIENLVLDQGILDVISLVVNAKNDYSDFIKGKSSGRVIMSTGEPGLGKTLTAEVYSELCKKPLYKVQSSQLGLKPEEIEKSLKKILSNATRWDCVLLIDEADTYVRKRGESVVQNGIVGVFLRLLEYYQGILFMTSNRGEEIDDAILSRCTIHIQYTYPTKENAIKIFKNLSKVNKFAIEDKDIEAILDQYEKISGRSIGVIVKNLKMLSEMKGEKPTVSLFKTIKNFIYIHEA